MPILFVSRAARAHSSSRVRAALLLSSQMVTQALWNEDSPLLQLPHFTKKLAAACADKDIEGPSTSTTSHSDRATRTAELS